jgi:hypothetical protein
MGTLFVAAGAASAAIVTVNGTDVIFLAGRTDVTLAPAGTPPVGYPLVRLSPPGAYAETFPEEMAASTGEQFQFSASGIVSYVAGGDFFGPDGSTAPAVGTSSINSLAGISGYLGPCGALAGVFLNGTDPESEIAPLPLDFAGAGDTSFTVLAPSLNQVFFIGDGLTGTGAETTQSFITPVGATRLFLGVPDGLYFNGAPGAYDDNSGAFTVAVTSTVVPEPSSVGLLAIGSLILCHHRRR